jgi:hypothetical protein
VISRLRLFLPLLLLLMLGSSGRRIVVEPVVAHRIRIDAAPLIAPKIETGPELRYLRGWALVSPDPDFGGFSALQSDGHRFLAVSDKGLLVHFDLGDDGKIRGGRIAPLPKGCASDALKTDRDSESITADPATGDVWIGFEWRNLICRAGPLLDKAKATAQPSQMREWAHTTGPETMVRLADGRFLVIEERPSDGSFAGPALLFPGDPTLPGAAAQEMHYVLPAPYFRPTEAAQLPDGRLLLLHRHFKPPFSFEAKIAIMEPIPPHPVALPPTRVIATLSRPGLTDNFEGMAISQQGGRTFVWLISDDNYLWIQHTYLLQYELISPTGN